MQGRKSHERGGFHGPLYEEVPISIEWSGGFSLAQKQRNIEKLHAAASALGIHPVLEISTKSLQEVGRRLSAFNLKIEVSGQMVSLESAYQSSKVFSRSGQHLELIEMNPFEAKKAIRSLGVGNIIAFRFLGAEFPTEPKNAFYDWLYIKAIAPHEDWIKRNLNFAAYSDIEFTPSKSINCQARAVAEFHALSMRGNAAQCAKDFDSFRATLEMAQREDGL